MHLIVHPLFVHQLDEPPLTLACTFHSFPFELLRLIALQLEECKDVCNFGLVNKECRWGSTQGRPQQGWLALGLGC